MTEQQNRIVCLGEVMVELTRGPDGRYAMGCGGDTFNTAVYLSRAGVNTAYATALGDDDYSENIVSLARVENVQTNLMLRIPGRLPGLYIIETDPHGERRFHYWRDRAPARELFELPDWGRIAEALVAAKVIYFSGITLALYSNVGLGRLFATAEMARQKGALIVFDGNFRPKLWSGDVARVRAVYSEALKRTDIALPTFDDEALLWGDASPEATIERLKMFGLQEVVVKNGQNPALAFTKGQVEQVAPEEKIDPVDTTAAGDSFNAAYLAARLTGHGTIEAVKAGHQLAGKKIRHRGAIMPREATVVH